MENREELNQKTKKMFRRLRLIFLLAVSVIICVLAFNHSGNSTSSKYVFKGNRLISDGELEALLTPEYISEKNDMSVSEIKKSLESHPFIKKAVVYRKSPEVIHANVNEVKPVAVVSDELGKLFFLCENYIVREYRNFSCPDDLILIRGTFKNGRIKRKSIDGALKIISGLKRPEFEHLYPVISEIIYNEKTDFSLLTQSGNTLIRLGSSNSIENKLIKLDKYIEGRLKDKNFALSKTADLRWKGCLVLN